MHTKLKTDLHENVLVVKTVHETKNLVTGIVIAIFTIGGFVIVVWQWMGGNKPPDLGLRHSLPIVLVLCALVLMIVAGWINLKAARAWHRARSDQLSGTSTAGALERPGAAVFAVGSKVRVKGHLTPEQKEAPPVWSPRMDDCLGRESVVKSINEHGRIILEDFPKRRFVKEWLDLEE